MQHIILLASTLFVSACVADVPDVESIESPLTSSAQVLTSEGCKSYASFDAATRNHLDYSERLVSMSPERRRAAGVTTHALSRGERASYEALHTDPCDAAADVSCVSGGENGTSWVMCTDGITTCGASMGAKVTVWCR
ncbi:MAG: hypothetical protein ACKV2T_26000 [Kofleriaceae bacterium]